MDCVVTKELKLSRSELARCALLEWLKLGEVPRGRKGGG
jgi:hypothetical protein